MNYNNPYNNPYYNPYQQYPYTQGNTQGTQQYTQMQYQQPQMQPQVQVQQPQTNYLPLTFVSGIEGAKAFIVPANSVIYLKDSESNLLFEKKADAQGKYTMTAFELKQVDPTNPNKVDNKAQNNINYVTKDTLKDYPTFQDFTKLEMKFDNALDRITRQLDKINNNYNRNNNNNNNINNNKKDSE